MKAKRSFNPQAALLAAKNGELAGAELRKAIERSEEFGLRDIARELTLYTVSPASFAGDEAPQAIRERVAQGISALNAMGHSLSRTRQMLKRHGVLETINRISKYPAASQNFERLRDAGFEHLTAEAIVVDYPELFSKAAVAVARKRLGR